MVPFLVPGQVSGYNGSYLATLLDGVDQCRKMSPASVALGSHVNLHPRYSRCRGLVFVRFQESQEVCLLLWRSDVNRIFTENNDGVSQFVSEQPQLQKNHQENLRRSNAKQAGLNHGIKYSINQSINQFVRPAIDRSIDLPINQSIDRIDDDSYVRVQMSAWLLDWIAWWTENFPSRSFWPSNIFSK